MALIFVNLSNSLELVNIPWLALGCIESNRVLPTYESEHRGAYCFHGPVNGGGGIARWLEQILGKHFTTQGLTRRRLGRTF